MTARELRGRTPRMAALVLSAALWGCSIERPLSDVPTSYDFGPTPAYRQSNPAIPGTVLVPSVRAPAWLEDDGIAYRLLYDDAARVQTYATSKWTAEPAQLLTERLRNRLAAGAQGVVSPAFGAQSDFTLRVELDDFSQHFAAPGESRALLRARATLLQSERRTLVAQQTFTFERPAAPNASGAVKALTQASDALVEALVKWVAATAGPDGKR